MTITTLEQPKPQHEVPNPYFIDLESVESMDLLNHIVDTYMPYADASTNPDLGTMSIYVLDGSQYGSDLARTAEATIMNNDPKWKQSRFTTMTDFAEIEDNSRFYMLVDNQKTGPELIGSLRIADCDKGPSETEKFFKSTHGNDVIVPEDMKSGIDRAGVWEVVLIVVKPEHQDGINSAWLYYAMHKNSLEENKKEWIANITDDEQKRLAMLGIPFSQIVGTEKIPLQVPQKPDEVQNIGFYHTPLDVVADSVDAKAEKYENRNGSAAIIGKLALIARFGSITRPKLTTETRKAS